MAKYLDENGVSYLWNKMTNYVDQQGTSGSSNPLKYYSQEFTSNGTFTVPENVYTIFITACGGGGGGVVFVGPQEMLNTIDLVKAAEEQKQLFVNLFP